MGNDKDLLKKLQLKMLRVQQGTWHSKKRLMIVFEGIDAAGKGGAIRRVTSNLDPRGVTVYPIGPPNPEDQGKHWLYRFWTKVPAKGMISIFDRSWYGRVLVERVEKLTSTENWKRAYTEINQFEKLMMDDGVDIIKIYLKITKDEQLKRYKKRLVDPYKQWKITQDDVRNRQNWDLYTEAVEDMIKKTSPKDAPWHVVETDDKAMARNEVLKIITDQLKATQEWMEEKAHEVQKNKKKILEVLKDID